MAIDLDIIWYDDAQGRPVLEYKNSPGLVVDADELIRLARIGQETEKHFGSPHPEKLCRVVTDAWMCKYGKEVPRVAAQLAFELDNLQDYFCRHSCPPSEHAEHSEECEEAREALEEWEKVK